MQRHMSAFWPKIISGNDGDVGSMLCGDPPHEIGRWGRFVVFDPQHTNLTQLSILHFRDLAKHAFPGFIRCFTLRTLQRLQQCRNYYSFRLGASNARARLSLV